MAPSNNSVLLLLFGLPGSGKTTLVNSIVSTFKRDASKNEIGFQWHPYVISYDILISADTQAKMVLNKGLAKECRQQLLQAAHGFLSWLAGKNHCLHASAHLACTILSQLKAISSPLLDHERALVLVDDNLYYRSMRFEWFKLARDCSLGFCQVFVSCPLDEAIRRNASRESPVPESSIRVMESKLELSREEPWETLCVTVLGGHGCLDEVVAAVMCASNSPIFQRETPRNPVNQVAPTSRRHLWDLELRAIVSELIHTARLGGASESEMSDWCSKVQAARRAVLAFLWNVLTEEEAAKVNLRELMHKTLGT